jgi:hypothetical protein
LAGDWIKIEKDTPDKPEVLAIASSLKITPDEAFGLCFRFWRWCDSQLVDGNARHVTTSVIDALIGRHGFADALIEVGWLQARNGSLAIPNFDRHMTESAKQRALTAKRVSLHKKRKGNGAVTEHALPREEKRREEIREPPKPPSIPQALDTPEFRSAWQLWLLHRREIKHPLKPTQVAQQIKLLERLGVSASIELIENTIASGWRGLRDKNGKSLPEIVKTNDPPSRLPTPEDDRTWVA